jgi:putative membrane protein
LVVATAGAALGLAPLWAFAQQSPESNRYGYGPYMMMDWSGWGYGMIFGPLFMIFVLVVAIAVAVVLVRGLGGPWQGTQPPHQTLPTRTPIDILKERYARGEIDKDEFEERRRVLGD